MIRMWWGCSGASQSEWGVATVVKIASIFVILLHIPHHPHMLDLHHVSCHQVSGVFVCWPCFNHVRLANPLHIQIASCEKCNPHFLNQNHFIKIIQVAPSITHRLEGRPGDYHDQNEARGKEGDRSVMALRSRWEPKSNVSFFKKDQNFHFLR